jgi:hypothetical protein
MSNSTKILGISKMTEKEMLRHTLDTLLRMEKRLDGHIDDEILYQRCVQKQLTGLKEEMAGNRVRWKTIIWAIGIAATGVVGWTLNHVSNV